MRQPEVNEIEAVEGAGFFGGLQGAFEGAGAGAGGAGVAIALGVAVTGPVGIGVVVGGAVIGAAAGYFLRDY